MPWQIYFLEALILGALIAVTIYEWRTRPNGDKEDIDEER